MTERWIEEGFHPHARVALQADEVLREVKAADRHLLVFRNETWGTVLMQDGAIRLTTADAFVQHEMLAHVPLMAHGKPRRILVLGGGDGGVLRQCLKHPSVTRVVLFESDRAVIDAALAYFPDIPGNALHDSRTQIVTGDALEYLRDAGEKFDAIIVDGSAPAVTSAAADAHKLFTACRRVLDDDGVLATRSGPASPDLASLKETTAILASLFKHVGAFFCAVPSIFGGPLAFNLAGDDKDLLELDADEFAKRHAKRAVADLKYWTPDVQVAAFALPVYAGQVVVDALAAAHAREEAEQAVAAAARIEEKARADAERAAAKAAKKEAKEREHEERAAAKAAKKEAKGHEEQQRAATKAAKKAAKDQAQQEKAAAKAANIEAKERAEHEKAAAKAAKKEAKILEQQAKAAAKAARKKEKVEKNGEDAAARNS